MDIDKLIQNKANRASRGRQEGKPFSNFVLHTNKCVEAAELVLEVKAPENFSELLEYSAIVSYVTSVEVYFRDMLDYIFKYCDPEYFLPKLRHIHTQKYDVIDLVDIFKNQIHPLELIAANTSFQHVDHIEKVFSKFLGKGFWNEVISQKIRGPGTLEAGVTFEASYRDGLQQLFSLRHELVHDKNPAASLSREMLTNMRNGQGLLLAADVVLSSMLEEHRDPRLEKFNTASKDA